MKYEESHITINCSVCGKERIIRNQDKHQVDKCKECQYDHRLRRRKELRDIKQAEQNV